MNEIKCPKCGEVFTIDERSYAAIVKQVRDAEFENEVKGQTEAAVKLAQAEKDKQISTLEAKLRSAQTEQQLAVQKAADAKQQEINERDQRISVLNSELNSQKALTQAQVEAAVAEAQRTAEKQIAEMQEALGTAESEKELAIRKAADAKQQEINERDQRISALSSELNSQKALAQAQVEAAVAEAQRTAEKQIAEMQEALGAAESKKELAVQAVEREKDQLQHQQVLKIQELESKIAQMTSEFELTKKQLGEKHADAIKQKDEEIAYYKDMKVRMSTKMVGESLEQHCETEFNRYRMTGFSSAYFEKDNDARGGSKGDYIFRDFDENGVEYISIMFEMKNEMEETATKHKNEDFLRKLDRDRKAKNCEYAVLVSLLEADNEYYNTGIVDMSYKYPKTYVIRPQFFLPLISLLRNAAQSSLEYRRELRIAQAENLDVQAFNSKLDEFKDRFSNGFRLASDRFADAIKEIDNSIDRLQKAKNALLTSEKHLRNANDRVEDLTIKRLTSGSPSLAQKFEDAGILQR